MESVLHEYTSLPTAIIKLICSYYTTEFEDKIRNLYIISSDRQYCLLSPYKRIQYLEFGKITDENRHLIIYHDNLRSKNFDYDFAIQYSHLARINYYDTFCTILGKKLFKLFDHKFFNYTLLEYGKMRCYNMVERYYDLIKDDNIETCTTAICCNSKPEVKLNQLPLTYPKVAVRNFVIDGKYDCLRTIPNLNSYDIPGKILSDAIKKDGRIAKLFAPQIVVKLSEASSFSSCLMDLIKLNIPEINLNINYSFYKKKIDMNILFTQSWYLDDLRNYHKHGIKSPLVETFNLNCNLTPRNIASMYEYMCLADIEYYYNLTNNKKFLTCNTTGYKQSYIFNKYYKSTGRINIAVKMHGNLKYYKLIKNALDESDSYLVMSNPHINEFLVHVE